ncbi:MAG: NUDIX hydrolase [Bacteroidota bacterium]
MPDLYSQHARHYVAVDCIIFGFDREELKLLLIKRGFDPGKGQWSLMGGFLGEKESPDEAASRILNELTGLGEIYLEQLQAYGEPARDPEARVISIGYYALINTAQAEQIITSDYQARWFSLAELPELVFDHNTMVEKALRRLRRRCRTQPVGFELLPEKFTLPQLMKLYEAIFEQEFDKRNFRKKMLSFGLLKKLEEKEKEGSRKGAFRYCFDEEKYEDMVRNGYSFGF